MRYLPLLNSFVHDIRTIYTRIHEIINHMGQKKL